MRHYFILWEEQHTDELTKNDHAHFYAIEKAGKLQYIGMCYGLDLAEEVKESLHVFGLESDEVSIWSGQVIRNIHNLVDQQLTEEILCLMVYNLQPRCNIICKRSYYGRSGLEVYNRGFKLMPQILNINKKVLVTTGLTGS